MICGRFVVDHSFDHLQPRTTWKQCEREHPKASFSDTKAPKSHRNQAKNRCRFVWEQDVAGSNPVIPTKTRLLSCGLVFCFATKASALALGEQAKTVNNRFCDAKSVKQGVSEARLCSRDRDDYATGQGA